MNKTYGRSLNFCKLVNCPSLKKKYSNVAGYKCFQHYFCLHDVKSKAYDNIGWDTSIIPEECEYKMEINLFKGGE
jgi:hypothetical protein